MVQNDPLFQEIVRKHNDSLPPKRIRPIKSAGKITVIIFFGHKNVICQHGVPPKTIVNSIQQCTAKNWHFEACFNKTLKNNTIRCKIPTTSVSGRKNSSTLCQAKTGKHE